MATDRRNYYASSFAVAKRDSTLILLDLKGGRRPLPRASLWCNGAPPVATLKVDLTFQWIRNR
jgi:hypothetical protein